MSNDELFNPENKVKPAFAKFNKIGDWFKGTYLRKNVVKSRLPGHENDDQIQYEFKAYAGEFHALDDNKNVIEEPIIPEEGTYWIISGKPEPVVIAGKSAIDNSLKNIKYGTIVGFKFESEIPNKQKGYNPAKIIGIYKGGMDPNYMGEGADDINPADVIPEG